MDILLLTVGKTTQQYVQSGIDEYIKRLRRYIPYKIECIADIRVQKP